MWEHMQSVANQGSSHEPWCPGSLVGDNHIHMLYLCDWTQLFMLQPPRAKTDTHYKSQFVSINFLSKLVLRAQDLRQTKSLLSGRIFQEFGVHFLGTGQGPVLKTGLSWEYAGFWMTTAWVNPSLHTWWQCPAQADREGGAWFHDSQD